MKVKKLTKPRKVVDRPANPSWDRKPKDKEVSTKPTISFKEMMELKLKD